MTRNGIAATLYRFRLNEQSQVHRRFWPLDDSSGKVRTNGLPLKVGARPSFVYGGASVKLHCDAAGYTIQRAGEAMAGEFFVDNLLSALLGSTAQITLNVK